MGSGEVAIVALSTMISLKVTFSDGLGEGRLPGIGNSLAQRNGPLIEWAGQLNFKFEAKIRLKSPS